MKVGIIGAGNVGAATAFALVLRGVAREVVLLDINQAKAFSEALDISHATTFAYASKVYRGDYQDLKSSDIIIISAGANQRVGETRVALMARNVAILRQIVDNILKYAPKAFILVASNPVDMMTDSVIKLSGLPKNQVFGSGTILDTSRFRTLIGEYLGVSSKSVHANVLGEHGDSEVLAWSNADIGTLGVEDFAHSVGKQITPEIKASIDDRVRNAAYRIIEGKGATYYGIAGALTRICQAVATNENAVLTVCSLQSSVEGVKDVCLSLPSIINKNGVDSVLMPKLCKTEHELLYQSAAKIKEYTSQIDII